MTSYPADGISCCRCFVLESEGGCNAAMLTVSPGYQGSEGSNPYHTPPTPTLLSLIIYPFLFLHTYKT